MGGRRNVAVIVAHPDDETLWAGGTILMHPEWDWTGVARCRRSDPDRAPRFSSALLQLGAHGRMADLDDSPEQPPLPEAKVQEAILSALPEAAYDTVLTHGPRGEYTRHLRHEETARAVVALWEARRIKARKLWMFAYDDGGGKHLPRVAAKASMKITLPSIVWQRKRAIIEETYGFTPDSFEARTTPREEAFSFFGSPAEAKGHLEEAGVRL